ncbi:hypothetical protein pipiens_015478 [Culex pipiens pipiens]|uniref:Uncharacterized protein n=1 Tax=Culex pipiens pipiens TaxID=38569 RepID=A0ABD1CQA5_CULPP
MDTEDSASEGGDGSTKVIEVNIPTSNQFDGLEDEQGDDPISLPPNPIPPPVLRIGEPAKGKKVRVPPISVVGKSTRQLREFLGQSRIQQTAFNMKATMTGVQLICSGEDTFRSALAALRGANIQYHTYTPAAEQPMKVVLSGLPVYDEAELETELAVLGVHVQELKLFSRKVAGLEESALYLLHFAKGTVKLSDLQKVKAVFNIVAKLAEKKAQLRNAKPPILTPPRNTVPQNDSTGNDSPVGTSTMTFAEALSQGSSNNINSNLFTMSEFLALAREVFARLKSCKSRLDQLEALVELTAKRQWYRRRDPIYQDIVSSLNRRIREECNQANFNKFKDTLRTLHDDRDTLWRITKALRKTTKYSPPLRKGTNIIASSSEKAKLLAASFASAHTNQMPDDPVTVAEVNNSIDAIDRTPLADNHSWDVGTKKRKCSTHTTLL